MTFGVNIYRAGDGGLTYSSTDVTWNQVDFFRVDGGSSYSASYPALSGREALVTQIFIDPPPTDARAYAHTLTVVDTTVSVSGGSVASYVLVLMR